MPLPETQEPWPVSRPVVAASVPTTGKTVTVEADAAECTALARFLGILSVEQAVADLSFMREGSRIRVTGEVTARVKQACVITLEPVPQVIRENVHLVFAPPDEAEAAAAASGLPGNGATFDDDGQPNLDHVAFSARDLDALDDPDAVPDPIVNGIMDAGAIMVETMAMALEPYPRAPGATFGEWLEDAPPSPFAALSKLRGEG